MFDNRTCCQNHDVPVYNANLIAFEFLFLSLSQCCAAEVSTAPKTGRSQNKYKQNAPCGVFFFLFFY